MRLFPVSSSSGSSSVSSPVKEEESSRALLYLNVYDLTPINNYLYWFGLGIFHSGIEVHGLEYGFGAHDYPTSGVFEVEPRSCPGFIFRRSVLLGSINMSRVEFRSFMEHVSGSYHGDSYHLIAKNCNHFTDEVSKRLTGKHIPGWVNRLARLGSFCNCLLPQSIQVTAVRLFPIILHFRPYRLLQWCESRTNLTLHNFLLFFYNPNSLRIENPFQMTAQLLYRFCNDIISESSASFASDGSEEDEPDHHLLNSPNGDVQFLQEKPMRLAKELM